jgi:hypothetical protein
MQASSSLYRQVSAAIVIATIYPVMEDEGKRQNENEIRRKKEREI